MTTDYIESIDTRHWEHPFLTPGNISRFRAYSEEVWEIGAARLAVRGRPPQTAFCVNMAQNMYNWARMASRHGADVQLLLHPQDATALSRPEWEEFAGDFPDIFDSERFLHENPGISLEVPCAVPKESSDELFFAYQDFQNGNRNKLLSLVSKHQGMRPELFYAYEGLVPYWEWAKTLNGFEVSYNASSPIAAYLSGRPYCASPVGGDLAFDSGRSDSYGQVMSLAFSGAKFILASNPILGHYRRLGFTNGVFLPYIMDTTKYSPGESKLRREWTSQFGQGFFVLCTSRLDKEVKGLDYSILQILSKLGKKHPDIKFIFMEWGNNKDSIVEKFNSQGRGGGVHFLPPAGKKKIIEYYRACDCVLDQLVIGFCGATSWEALAVGKPIIMRIRTEDYRALYNGSPPPILNVEDPKDIVRHIKNLYRNSDYRRSLGEKGREWLVENHGDARWTPILLGLLSLTADMVPLPPHLENPLLAPLSPEEEEYHRECLVQNQQQSI